jgi:hypothetical protein
MCWDIKNDLFVFKLNFVKVSPSILSMQKIPTKRETLKVLMAVFDPHGFVSPILVNGKILIQEMWRVGIEWDEELQERLFKSWCSWLNELKLVDQIAIPRCFSNNLQFASEVQLQTFVDASEEAYCAVIYLRIVHKSGCDVTFVAS